MKKYIRDWRFIYNSKIDFVDLYLSLTILLLGVHLLVKQPIQQITHYHFLIENNITSMGLGVASLLTRNDEYG